MSPEILLLQELVKTFGTVGTLLILGGAIFLYYTKHRRGSAPVQAEKIESTKVREKIATMVVSLDHVEKDLVELKTNMKEDRDTVAIVSQNLTTHLQQHD